MTDLFDPLPAAPAVRRRENTRSRLVRASLAVFVDKGIDGATIDDLVTAAGFTRGAFYSSFSSKEEVFGALFEVVTDEVIQIIRATVDEALAAHGTTASTTLAAADPAMMVGVFEAIRPYGRQWYLLYSEAVARALRAPEGLEGIDTQRHRVRDAIADALRRGMEAKGERCAIAPEQLAQTLIGVFSDFMMQEHLDGANITDLAGETILRIMRAFIGPPPESAPPPEPAPRSEPLAAA